MMDSKPSCYFALFVTCIHVHYVATLSLTLNVFVLFSVVLIIGSR